MDDRIQNPSESGCSLGVMDSLQCYANVMLCLGNKSTFSSHQHGAAVLVQTQNFLPEMKSLQHQNNQEATSLSHCIAKKEIIPHWQPIVTIWLISILCATRTILNREQHKSAKHTVWSALSASTPQLEASQQRAFSFRLSSSQASLFPMFQGSLKTENIWSLLDLKRFLLAAVSLLHL